MSANAPAGSEFRVRLSQPLNRREFLSRSAVVAVGAAAPAFFTRTASATLRSDAPGGKDTLLVVIELAGGNDGLNTVIPFRDPLYAAARPELRQPADRVRKINMDVAFHPELEGFDKLLQRGELAVVQGVGYPQPNRSHFASMDIWHTALMEKDRQQYGWLGRTSGQLGRAGVALQIGDDEPRLALKGVAGNAPSLRSLAEYQLKTAVNGDDEGRRRVIQDLASGERSTGGLRDLLRRSAQETYQSAESLRRVKASYSTPVSYPASGLAQRMKLIAQLIDAGVSERIYYTTLGGFDTHSQQLETHAELLRQLGDALNAFHADLNHHGHGERVATLVFSEFGRRVKENGSAGTDHGAAAPIFLAGKKIRSGVHGAHPKLDDLDDGDLKHHTDFRSVYATLLDGWLKTPSEQVLGAKYPPLELV